MDPVDFRSKASMRRSAWASSPESDTAPSPANQYKMVADWKGVVAIHLWDDLITPVCSKKLSPTVHP